MTAILNSISKIIEFVSSIGNLFLTFMNLLPTPFNLIFQGYIILALVLFLWKVYKGG